LRVIGSAIPDPARAWDSSSAYATVDKRIIGPERVQRALQEAEDALREHMTVLHEGLRPVFRAFFAGSTEDAARHLIALGERQEAAGRVRGARECYRSALSLSLPLPDKAPQTLALRRIARVALSLGALEEATAHYDRAAELADDSDDLEGSITARTGLGNVLMYQGRWAEAEARYAGALALIPPGREAEHELARGQLFNNLGNTAIRQGRFDDADAWLTRARDLWNRVDSPLDLAVCYLNIGQLRQSQERFEDAHEVYAGALKLPVPPGLSSLIACDLTELCLRDRRIAEAERWGRAAEEHAIAAGSPYNIGRVYHILGTVAAARGDDDGFTFFEKALEIAREKGYHFLEADTLLDYAELRRRTGGFEEAEAYLERSLELFACQDSVQYVEDARDALGRVRAEMGAAPRIASAAD
jgi:tetratricopeptide (TPR) repeat protein